LTKQSYTKSVCKQNSRQQTTSSEMKTTETILCSKNKALKQLKFFRNLILSA